MIGITPIYDEYGRLASPRRGPTMPEEEKQDLLRSLVSNSWGALDTIAKTLDTPGAIARGVLAGDPLSGFSWDSERRVTGDELLKSYGLTKDWKNPYATAMADFGVSVLTDPMTWAALPMSALTRAGKAARAAGVLDYAPIAAQRRMGAAAKQTLTGRAADAALDELLPMGLAKNEANYAIRPLVGPRAARLSTTLDEAVQAAPDPQEALTRVTQYLGNKGLGYDDIKGEKLGGLFGFGPFTFAPPGSSKVADALDAAGQAIAWSKPARLASSLFDQRVAGMTEAGDQLEALKHWNRLEGAKQMGRAAAASHAFTATSIPMTDRAKSLLGADSLMSPQGNDLLQRAFEGKMTATDRAVAQALPGFDSAVQSWDRLRRTNVAEAKRLGLNYTEIKDKHGTLYSPRTGSEFDFGEYGEGYGRSLFNTRTLEGMSRNPALSTPGGTSELREISMLQVVRDYAMQGRESPQSAASVGAEIVRFVNGRAGRQAIDQAQGEAIAGVMYRLNKDLPANVPAFAGHPLNEQTRVIVSQAVARENAKYVYDSLVDSAIPAQYRQVGGSGFRNLDAAAQEIAGKVGLKTGAAGLDSAVRKQIVDRVAAKFGMNPSQVDLSQLSIPEEVYNRLGRIQDFYSSPRAQQEVSGLLDSFTNLFKSAVLAWPARHVRDMYSNVLSVWLETGNPAVTYQGFSIAKSVLAGNIDDVLPRIAKLPQYQGINDTALLKRRFFEDAASSGVLQSLAQSDLLTARQAGDVSRVLPGVTPVTRSGAFRELLPDGSRNPLQMLGDVAQIRGLTNKFETRNPVLNWSQKLSDANDSIARLGGWIALLSQGNSPLQSADRIKRSLVDYGSLTTFERGFAKKIFPWWTYQSRIGKYVVESMLQNPGGQYAQALRGMDILQRPTEETYIPEGMRQQFTIRIPDGVMESLGMTQPPGTQTVLRNFDYPGVDALSLWQPDSIQGTIGNLFGQTNPFIKGAAELAFNQDLFSKRPLDQSNPAINKIYRAISGGDNLSPLAKVVGSNIPGTQRLVNLAGGLLDDRLPLPQRLVKEGFNTTAGIQAAVIDPDYADTEARRELAKDLRGYTNDMVISTIDKERIQDAPPDLQRKALLDQVLAAEQRKARAAEKPRKRKATSLSILGY